MFWTDRGNPPKIEKLTLHGTNRVAIVTTNLLKPYGITLDRRNKLIFWVDDGMDVIESVDYNGNSRKLLFHRPGMSFSGVTFTSSYLFINGWNQNWVSQLDAYNGTVVGNVTTGGILTGGIVALNGSLQLPGLCCNLTKLHLSICSTGRWKEKNIIREGSERSRKVRAS